MRFEDIKKIDDDMKTTAFNREIKNTKKMIENGGARNTLPGRMLMVKATNAVKHINEKWLVSCATQKTVAENKRYSRKLFKMNENEELEPIISFETLTYMSAQLTISALLTTEETTTTYILKKIGDNIERELLYLHFEEHHPRYLKKMKKGVLNGENSNLKYLNLNLQAVNKQLEENRFEKLSGKEKIKIAMVLFNNLVKNTEGILQEGQKIIDVVNIDETKKCIVPSKSLTEWMKTNITFLAEQAVKYEPVEYIPEDFNTIFQGGYKTLNNPLCKTMSREFIKETQKVDLQETFNFVNTLQKTGYRIHKETYEVIDYYYSNELDLMTEKGGHIIPSRKIGNDHIEITEGLKNDFLIVKEKNKLYKTEKKTSEKLKKFLKENKEALDRVKEHRQKIKKQIIIENKNRGKLTQYSFSVDQSARKLLDKTFYLPVQLDARGRQYYVPFLNIQTTDFTKGIFTFAKEYDISTDLNSHDLKQFFIQGANEYGMDKLIHKHKIQFVLDNMQNILNSAENPYEDNAFWKMADKPVLFLQFCFEFRKYLRAVSNNEETFKTSLIRFSDGKCNGLQWLSAISRSENAGRLVALIDEDETLTDIYETVAKEGENILKECLSKKRTKFCKKKKVEGKTIEIEYYKTENGFEFRKAYVEMIKIWKKYGIKRSVSKQPVMTIGYNSKRKGRIEQIKSALADIETKGEVIPFSIADTNKASEILADVLEEASKRVMPEVIELMRKIEELSKIFTRYTKTESLVINSPYFNFPFVQSYKKENDEYIKIKHLEESIYLTRKVACDTTSAIRMANSTPPNLIHLCDVTHEALVVNEMAKRHGSIDFAGIHDSFGVSPLYAEELNQVIREMFVKMNTEICIFDLLKQSIKTSGLKELLNRNNIKLVDFTKKKVRFNLITENNKTNNLSPYYQSEKDNYLNFLEEVDNVCLTKGNLDLDSVLTSHRFFD